MSTVGLFTGLVKLPKHRISSQRGLQVKPVLLDPPSTLRTFPIFRYRILSWNIVKINGLPTGCEILLYIKFILTLKIALQSISSDFPPL